jgi:DNA replication protein DnaC
MRSTGRSTAPEPPRCSLCDGSGWYTRRVPVDHPDFGRLQECECGLVQRRRIESCAAVSNLSASLARQTFETWRPAQGAAEAHKEALAFANDPTGWLVFMGDPGCGKTHLASAIYHRLTAAGLPVAFVNWPSFLSYLREAFSPEARQARDATFTARFDVVLRAPVLILDDVGAERGTEWTEEQLYRLLDHRTVNELPTVITSNCRPDELGHERIASRLLNARIGRVVVNKAADYRRGS